MIINESYEKGMKKGFWW